jgi:hypothetical protein
VYLQLIVKSDDRLRRNGRAQDSDVAAAVAALQPVDEMFAVCFNAPVTAAGATALLPKHHKRNRGLRNVAKQ